MEWFTDAVFGALVGAGELVTRYRDAPLHSLRSLPAILYIVLSAASVGAMLHAR